MEYLLSEKEVHRVYNNVTETPRPGVSCYRSVNGKRKLIAKCSAKRETCLQASDKDVEFKFDLLFIRNASYLSQNNVTYICEATNVKGKDEKAFTIFVKSKFKLKMQFSSRYQLS